MIKGQRPLGVEVTEMEPPPDVTSTAEKVAVEEVEDGSFLVVIMELAAIMIDDLNFVVSVSLISTGMEIPGVLITLNGSPDLAALLPKS